MPFHNIEICLFPIVQILRAVIFPLTLVKVIIVVYFSTMTEHMTDPSKKDNQNRRISSTVAVYSRIII